LVANTESTSYTGLKSFNYSCGKSVTKRKKFATLIPGVAEQHVQYDNLFKKISDFDLKLKTLNNTYTKAGPNSLPENDL
jgi:hypothetical protein